MIYEVYKHKLKRREKKDKKLYYRFFHDFTNFSPKGFFKL